MLQAVLGAAIKMPAGCWAHPRHSQGCVSNLSTHNCSDQEFSFLSSSIQDMPGLFNEVTPGSPFAELTAITPGPSLSCLELGCQMPGSAAHRSCWPPCMVFFRPKAPADCVPVSQTIWKDPSAPGYMRIIHVLKDSESIYKLCNKGFPLGVSWCLRSTNK